MATNITFTETSNNIADLAAGITTNLGSTFPAVLLFIIWLSFYGLTVRNGSSAAFIASNFVTSIAGVIMMLSGFTTWQVVVVPVVLFVGSLAYRFFTIGK